jgi:Protein of unknown function (DUF3551)
MRSPIKIVTAAAAVVAGLTMFDASPADASDDAPWCAVINLGMGDARWDCRYRTVEECVPNVIAGDRGFCNLNPRGPGPARPAQAPKRHYKHRAPNS